MTLPRVLFLSPFFYPEAISTGKYNTLLVRALVARGVEVEVVCSHPLYPAWKPVRSDKTIAGTVIQRGGAWMRYPHSMVLRRGLFELWFAWHATLHSWQSRKNPTAAVAIFPPTLFFTIVRTLLPASTKKIGIVHDLQGVLGLGHGGLFKSLVGRITRALETRAFRSCDRLIVLSDSMARRVTRDYGIKENRVAVCYPFVTVRPKEKPGTNLESLFFSQSQVVVYAGALGKKHNSSGLLEFFQAAAARLPEAHFHIFSEGPEFEELRKRNVQDSTGRIHWHGLVSEDDLEELYARSTVQVIPQLDQTGDACLPSKLPNILAMGCMLLAICQAGTELAQIIGQTHAGVAAYSWKKEELIDALVRALDQARLQGRERRQALVADLLERRFSLESLVNRVIGETGDGLAGAPGSFGR